MSSITVSYVVLRVSGLWLGISELPQRSTVPRMLDILDEAEWMSEIPLKMGFRQVGAHETSQKSITTSKVPPSG